MHFSWYFYLIYLEFRFHNIPIDIELGLDQAEENISYYHVKALDFLHYHILAIAYKLYHIYSNSQI